MPDTRACPKCNSRMETGFLFDRNHHDMGKVGEWIEGQPEQGWFGLKLKGRQRRPITTLRCERCGFLELYARSA